MLSINPSIIVRFLVRFIKAGFDLHCIDHGVYAKEWKNGEEWKGYWYDRLEKCWAR
jgi:hypothetical protein